MQNRAILFTLGLAVVFGIGFFVYETKQPMVLPLEDLTTPTVSPTPIYTYTPTPTSTTLPTTSTLTATPRIVTPTLTPTLTPTPTPTPSGITYAQISMHNSRSSCWSAINGSVYDLTSWIPNHPGGESKILAICGKDGSSAYNNQHGGQPKPAGILVGFKIGTLAQ